MAIMKKPSFSRWESWILVAAFALFAAAVLWLGALLAEGLHAL